MSCGIIDLRMNAVKPMTVVPLIHRFGRPKMTLITSLLNRRVEVKRPEASPGSELHLVVSIDAPRIEDKSLADSHIDSNISFPQVTMNQC